MLGADLTAELRATQR